MKNHIYFVLLFVTLFYTDNFAQIHISGEVTGNWNADTVFVDGNISVPINQTLTIEPGTNVYFTGEYEFNVYGTLIADGTEADSIFFFSDSLGEISTWPYYEGFWYGITFHATDSTGQESSSLDYCNIKYAYPTWLDEMMNRFGGGLVFYKSQIDVSHTTFTDCLDNDLTGGVFTAIYSEGNINGVSFLKTTSYRAGTLTLLSSDVVVDNLFMFDAYGIYIDSSNIEIRNSTLDNCSPYIQWGIINTVNSEVEITNCDITNNNGTGILAQYSTLTIMHTLLKGNSSEGGVFYESPSTLINCEIIENGLNGLIFKTKINFGTTFTSHINNCVVAKNGATGISFQSRNNAEIVNCTIADNVSVNGWGGVKTGEVETHLNNCIIYNNGNDLDFQAGGLYTYSIIQGNYAGQDTASTNLQNVLPFFRSSETADYHLQSVACGFNINSPAIDAGHPAISDFVIDCSSAGLGTIQSDIGAYGGADNQWDETVLPVCHYKGEVSGVWDCDSIYVLGDVTIPAGDTLFITENVKKVKFEGKYQMIVNGVLLAIGEENENNGNGLAGNYIVFEGSPIHGEYWRGILFNNLNNNGVGTSIIKNCRFNYAGMTETGAIFINNSDNVIISQSLFYENFGSLGGAIYIKESNPEISDSYFEKNGFKDNYIYANSGGALYLKYSNAVMHNLKFVNNKSFNYGGAIFMSYSAPVMHNILLVKNSTLGDFGGAIYLNHESNPDFINLTIADNIADSSGGALFVTDNSNPSIINSIMYNNTKPEIYFDGVTPTVTYSLIDSASSEAIFGIGCLDEDPRFKMTDENYYYLSSTACGDDINSPAIDAGHPDSLDAVLDCGEGLGTARADMGYYGGRYSEMIVDVANENRNEIPTKYDLSQNYPNPFNPTTTIAYSIPSVIARSPANDGKQSAVNVTLIVYNILGQKVATLVNKQLSPGNYSTKFNATNLSSGIYFYRLQAGSFVATKKMILMK